MAMTTGESSIIGVACSDVSQSLSSKFSVQLETREIDIDTTNGNLPKLGLTYVWISAAG